MSGGTTATLVTTAITTAISMAGQYMQAQAQEKQAKQTAQYQADVAAQDAAMKEQQARSVMQKAITEEDRQRRNVARAMGEMRANMGASGFAMDEGSNMDLLAESVGEHQYDSQVRMSNAEQEAWGYQVGATNAQNNQAFANWQKSNADSGQLGTYLSMGGTLLGGISKGIGQYSSLSAAATPTGGTSNIFGKSSGVSSTWSKSTPYSWLNG